MTLLSVGHPHIAILDGSLFLPAERAWIFLWLDNFTDVCRLLVFAEAYTGKTENDDDGEPISKNISWLAHFVRNHGILREALLPRSDSKSAEPLLHTIRVMLSHLNLDFRLCGESYGFPDSQLMVYRSSVAQPIFLDPSKQKVDMLYVLHLVNFFKYHMTRRHEYTLFDEYTAMGDLERPQAWRSQIKAGSSKLGRHWKGTYSENSSPAHALNRVRFCEQVHC